MDVSLLFLFMSLAVLITTIIVKKGYAESFLDKVPFIKASMLNKSNAATSSSANKHCIFNGHSRYLMGISVFSGSRFPKWQKLPLFFFVISFF